MKLKALILQSGGSTAVINQSLAGVIDAANKSRKFSALFGSKYGILGALKKDWIRLDSLSPQTARRLRNSPSSALGTCRRKLNPSDAGIILKRIKSEKIDVLFLIGGNDTAETGLMLTHAGTIPAKGEARQRRHELPLQVIGIPKTIVEDRGSSMIRVIKYSSDHGLGKLENMKRNQARIMPKQNKTSPRDTINFLPQSFSRNVAIPPMR